MSGEEKLKQQICEIVAIFKENFEKNRGIFGIEGEADQMTKLAKLEFMKNKIEAYNRGYKGNSIRCSKCGTVTKRYKGDESKTFRFESGELKILRSRYVCCTCNESSYPLDEELGLVSGKEQGKLREKSALIGILSPYNMCPDVCMVLLGSDTHAQTVRRLTLRESERYEASQVAVNTKLAVAAQDTVYLEVDGHMCPTRDERTSSKDQGYREAKAVIAFNGKDVADVSKNRCQITEQILKAKITTASEFNLIFSSVYTFSNASNAHQVVALADGAHWIWNIIDKVAPEAIQILDFSHAKSYLYKAAELIYGNSDLAVPWVKKQEDLLFEDAITTVLDTLKTHASITGINDIITYFTYHQHRMRYGTFKKMNLYIGSGAIESAGKRIAQARVKGGGMRWNIGDLNKLLYLRCSWLDSSWNKFWNIQKLQDLAA